MSLATHPRTYTATLLGRWQVAERTLAFSVSKPAAFTFSAGQAIELTLPDLPILDPEGNASRTGVFLAGGIGVTPFRSILHHVAEEHLPRCLYLFHASRRPEDAPFLEEFQALERSLPKFTYIPTMTQLGRSSRAWPGETGRISRELLSGVLTGVTRPVYYVAGSPPMVASMRALLTEMQVPDADIRTESFLGY